MLLKMACILYTTATCWVSCVLKARPVYIMIVFVKIGEIDTVNEKYSAELFFQAKWREPELDGKTSVVGGEGIVREWLLTR